MGLGSVVPALGGPCKGWAEDAKKSIHASDSERVVGLRQAFLEALTEEEVSHFIFVDDTSTNLTYCRRYGRVPGGQRVA